MSSAVGSCRDCGAETVRGGPRGRAPIRCGRCRLAVRARREAGHRERRRAGEPMLRPECSAGWGIARRALRFAQISRRVHRCEGCSRWYIRKPGRPIGQGCRFCSRACAFESMGIVIGRRAVCPSRDRRRDRIRSTRVGTVSRRRIAERDNWICWLCNRPTTREWGSHHNLAPTLDHVIPLAKGGVHGEENLRLAHRVCNCIKGTKILAEGATAWAAADHPLSLAL